MNPGCLREDVLPDNRFIDRDAASGEHLDELAHLGKRSLLDMCPELSVVAKRDDDFVE